MVLSGPGIQKMPGSAGNTPAAVGVQTSGNSRKGSTSSAIARNRMQSPVIVCNLTNPMKKGRAFAS